MVYPHNKDGTVQYTCICTSTTVSITRVAKTRPNIIYYSWVKVICNGNLCTESWYKLIKLLSGVDNEEFSHAIYLFLENILVFKWVDTDDYNINILAIFLKYMNISFQDFACGACLSITPISPEGESPRVLTDFDASKIENSIQ